MAAIVVSPFRGSGEGPEHHMPFSSRLRVAYEINALWAEFVTEMHDGPTTGQEVADKFWKFVTTRGRPS